MLLINPCKVEHGCYVKYNYEFALLLFESNRLINLREFMIECVPTLHFEQVLF